MSFRLRKVTERFKEIKGQDFKKISEDVIRIEALVDELDDSIKTFQEEKPKNDLEIQRLQAQRIVILQEKNRLTRHL